MLSLFSFALFGGTRRRCREILQRRAREITTMATGYYKQVPSAFALQIQCSWISFLHPLL